jgi:hypothetical protein
VVSGATANAPAITTNTTYTLTATNISNASATATATVTVVPAPTASITTTNANITSGTSTTITPIFSNHVTALIDGSTNVQNQSFVSGTVINVGPLTQNRTYTLVVTNSAGTSVNASVSIGIISFIGWSGIIQFNKFAGFGTSLILINIRAGNASVFSTTNTTSIATNTVYTTDININVSLQTPQTYLYISVYYTSPAYYVSSQTLVDRTSGALPITYFDEQSGIGLSWRRYGVPTSASGTIYFEFQTIQAED